MSLRLGVLVSGQGTNLQALIEATRQPDFPAWIVLVGCNRAEAAAVERAKRANLPVCLADRRVIRARAERQKVLQTALEEARADLVVLAGYDEILSPEFVAAFAGRLLNTHPSLLPAFAGTMHAVAQALEAGVKVTGCTVHLVTDQVDGGPILLQRCVEVLDDDTVDTLRARIQAQEHQLLPEAVRAFAERHVFIEGRRARVVGSPGGRRVNESTSR